MTTSRRGSALIPAYGRWPLLAALAWHCAVYWGAKLLTAGWPHRCMAISWDAAVPLLPWTVVIYAAAYLFWGIGYILAVRLDRETCFRLLAADALSKAVCLVIFLLLPTMTVRPDIPAGAPMGRALAFLYASDTPEGLFPSMHCLCSWLCWAAVRGRREVPAPWRAFSLVFALAVALSTLTTKQHVLADVPAGIFLGELCWQIAGPGGLGARYGRLWERRAAPAEEARK